MLNILTDTSKSSILRQWHIEFVVLGTNWSGRQRNHSCFSWRQQLWSPLQWAAAPLCAVFDHDVWSQLPTFIWPHDFKSQQAAMLAFPTYSESCFNGIFQKNVTLNLRTEQALSSSQCPITHMFKKKQQQQQQLCIFGSGIYPYDSKINCRSPVEIHSSREWAIYFLGMYSQAESVCMYLLSFKL